jgi:exodeoxyribonuclease III
MKKRTLLSWNVNGIRAAERKGFLDWFAKEKPDILGVQETKAHPEQLSDALKEIHGYTTHFCSAERKGYSGVGLFSKVQPESIACGLGVEKFDKEGRVISADYGEFLFYTIYFPNGCASNDRLIYKIRFYEAFLKEVKKQIKAGRKVVVCGDVNTAHHEIDLARPKQNVKRSGFLPEERLWLDKFERAGLVDTFRLHHPNEPDWYSWWDVKTRSRERNVGWRIDYFYVSENLVPQVKDAFILTDVMGSDHCPVGITLKI